MEKTKSLAFGTVALRLAPTSPPPGDVKRVRFVVRQLAVVGAGEIVLSQDRVVEFDFARPAGITFLLRVPAGAYRAVRLNIGKLETLEGRPMLDADPASLELKLALSVAPAHATVLTLNIDGKALRRDLRTLKPVITATASSREQVRATIVAAKGRTTIDAEIDLVPGAFLARSRLRDDSRLGFVNLPGRQRAPVRIDMPAGALPPGTRVVVKLPEAAPQPDEVGAPAGLPPLFRNQRVVGPAVKVTSAAQLGAPVELMLPYDHLAMSAASATVDNLVVMAIDNGHRLYRELRPIAVDTAAHTVRVVTNAFSTFFPCTEGIAISQPRLRRDAAGGASAWSSGLRATVAGQVADERGSVALFDADGNALPSAASWQARGWFSFETIALRPRATPVRVRATVDGLVAHECEFTIRAAAPSKRITDASRQYGPRLAVGADDVPMVTSVGTVPRFSGTDVVAPLDAWQRAWGRHGPYVYRPRSARAEDGGVAGDRAAGQPGWEWRGLLPDIHFEEQTARRALATLQQSLPIVLRADLPEERRALSSLASYVATQPADGAALSAVSQALDAAGREFGVGTLSLSPTIPIAALPDGTHGAAFVAATAAGADLAAASALRVTLEQLHRALGAPAETMSRVNAGQLLFVVGSFEEGFHAEVIANGIWCATVQLRVDPRAGQPVVAALEVDGGAGDPARSRLVLFRRAAGGAWSREQVVLNLPIVDFDFDFTPGRTPDGGSEVAFVTASAGTGFDIKTHMRYVFRDAAGWHSSPMEYEAPWDRTFVTDHGLWPRLTIDAQGRGATVFAFFVAGRITWMILVSSAGVSRAAVIAESNHEALTGSPLPPLPTTSQGPNIDSPVSTSGLSLANWMHAIAPAGERTLLCAVGNGVLSLVRIDLDSLQSSVQVVDVDRMIGFFPAIAIRRGGVPAIAYKDVWGAGGFGPDARDDLLFFSLEQGNVVPPAELPLAPPHAQVFIGLFPPNAESHADLAPHVALNCSRQLARDPNALLTSLVLHRPFSILLIPSEGDDPLQLTRIQHAHAGLSDQLGRLQRRPAIQTITVDNSAFPAEDIESIEIAIFAEPIGYIPRSEIFQLNRGVMTATVLRALYDTGVQLSHTFPRLVVRQPGSAWDIIDEDAYIRGGILLPNIAQTYLVRDNGSQLEIRLPPIITVFDRAGYIDVDSHSPSPCGFPPEFWDEIAAPLAGQLNLLELKLPDIPGRYRWLRASGIRLTRVAPHDPPDSQQGGVRITLEIPHFVGFGANPEWFGFATESSYVHMTLAPYVQGGFIRWWVRDSEVRIGHIEVDVDLGLFPWLAVLVATIPGLGFLLGSALGADFYADSVATSSINEGLKPPDATSLQRLLQTVMQEITHVRGGWRLPPLEAAFLRAMTFTTYFRSTGGGLAELPPTSQATLLPAAISFGTATAGGMALARNALITNDGSITSLLEELRIEGDAVFRIASPRTWPRVLSPGSSETINLEFDPRPPAGFRAADLVMRTNGGHETRMSLRGTVEAPPEPRLRLQPPNVDFGLVTIGWQQRREVQVFNEGRAPLEIAVPQLLAPGVAAGVIVLETPSALTLPVDGAATVALRFTPQTGGPAQSSATLVLLTNDPTQFRVEVPVFGVAATGALSVRPTALAFSDTPTAPNFPPLPPGLPPTVHAGSTRSTMISNFGTADITIVGASFRPLTVAGGVSPHYRLWRDDGTALLAADIVLGAGDIFTVVIEFAAAALGEHIARLEVRTDDPGMSVLAVTLRGRAIA